MADGKPQGDPGPEPASSEHPGAFSPPVLSADRWRLWAILLGVDLSKYETADEAVKVLTRGLVLIHVAIAKMLNEPAWQVVDNRMAFSLPDCSRRLEFLLDIGMRHSELRVSGAMKKVEELVEAAHLIADAHAPKSEKN